MRMRVLADQSGEGASYTIGCFNYYIVVFPLIACFGKYTSRLAKWKPLSLSPSRVETILGFVNSLSTAAAVFRDYTWLDVVTMRNWAGMMNAAHT